MAKVFPFRGYRYDEAEVGEIAEVVSQPYDKISESMREAYLKRHDRNIVRVIKNPDYSEAGRFLNEWIQSGVLKQDADPAIYFYEQTFQFEGSSLSRLGLIGLVSLQDSGLNVKGHERVLEQPLQDRLRLIRATEANEGLIFTLYSDPPMETDRVLKEFTARVEAMFEIEDEYGVSHRLWRCADRLTHEVLQQQLADRILYIADGHHRFQTSLLFDRECREKGWLPAAPESFDKRLVALFNMDSPGLKILPTHRAVRNVDDFDREKLLEQLRPFFEIEPLTDPEKLAEAQKGPGNRLGLLISEAPDCLLLKLKTAALQDPSFMPALEGAARELDVNILHEGILNPLLGIGTAELASERYVAYFRQREELVRQLRERKCQAGFLLNPTTLEQVRRISELGWKMPQKSTDFYPKLLTGLVIMKMGIDRSSKR